VPITICVHTRTAEAAVSSSRRQTADGTSNSTKLPTQYRF
jgi:hypothetical protein